jgi:hypothetical protein
VRGAAELKAALRQLSEQFPREAERALYSEALKIERLSRSLTPVEFGALRGSHETSRPVDGAVTISVGGPAAPYAVYVHENLEARHPVGQAKFLEGALNASRDDFFQGMADHLRRALANAT